LRNLEGGELVAALAECGEGAILEALWRLDVESVRVRLVPQFADSEMIHLSDLVVREVLDPNPSAAVCGALMTVLDDHLIEISTAANHELATRLVDRTPFNIAVIEDDRAILEQQVLSAEDDDSLEFALVVLRNETARADDDAVRESAFDRLKLDSGCLKSEALNLAEALVSGDCSSTWGDACRAAAVMAECDAANEESQALAAAMVRACPSTCPSEILVTAVGDFIREHGLIDLRQAIEGESLPDSPGSRALLRTVEGVNDGRSRLSLFVAACTCQAGVYARVIGDLEGTWTPAEWDRRLGSLSRSRRPVPRHISVSLLQQAPPTAMAASVRLAVKQPCVDEEPTLIREASENVRAWLENEVADDDDALLELSKAFYWPENASSEVMARIGEVVSAVCPGKEWEVIVPAFLSSAISVDSAVSLLPPGQYEMSLEALGPSEDRLKLCQGLAERDPDLVCEIVRNMQGESFSLDLCEACAPTCPDAAFVGGDRAWGKMTESVKDTYVHLLCVHGTSEQLPLLSRVVADSKRRNTGRRCQATLRVSELTPKGGEVCASVLDLLDTGVPELMRAATEAIGAVCPTDASTLRKLRQAVSNGGVPADSADQAFAAVEDSLLALLEAEPETAERARILEGIGVCGSKRGVLRLLDHVGPAAEDTHLLARMAAAKALAENSLYDELSVDALERLARLLDGKAQETHIEVRESLSMACVRANLGEDAALAELYNLIGLTPRGSADELFGKEKESLVRQLTLLAQEEKRGPAGWGAWLAILDTVAERLVRAVYVHVGVSQPLQDRIRRGVRGEPDYGELLQSLSSVPTLVKVKPFLETVHSLRCTDTEITHPGERPKEETVAAAKTPFQKAAKQIVGVLDTANE
jgi:hypothetical protein